MPQPFTDRELDQQDAVLTRRVQSEDWRAAKPTKSAALHPLFADILAAHGMPQGEAGRVLDTLGDVMEHSPAAALPVRADAPPEPAEHTHYVTWITLKGGEVKREPVGYCADEDEAIGEAQRIACAKYPGRIDHLTVMARAA